MVSFGIRKLGSKSFISRVENFLEDDLTKLNSKMCENLLFFLTSLNSTNKDFIKKLLKHIEYSGFVATGEFIDHI